MFKIAIRIQIISNRGRRTALWGQRCRQSPAHIAFKSSANLHRDLDSVIVGSSPEFVQNGSESMRSRDRE